MSTTSNVSGEAKLAIESLIQQENVIKTRTF